MTTDDMILDEYEGSGLTPAFHARRIAELIPDDIAAQDAWVAAWMPRLTADERRALRAAIDAMPKRTAAEQRAERRATGRLA